MKISVFYDHVQQAAKEQGLGMEEALDWVRANGIDAVEINADNFDDDGPDDARETEFIGIGRRFLKTDPDLRLSVSKLKNLLKGAGLEVSNVVSFYDWQEHPEDMRGYRQLSIAKTLGAHLVMPIPGLYSKENLRTDQQKKEHDNMLGAMQQFTAEALRQGLLPVIEDFDNVLSPIRNISGMREFLDACPGLGVAFDTGNFRYSAEDVLKAYPIFRDKIKHVHLKDRHIPTDRKGFPVIVSDTAGTENGGVIPTEEDLARRKRLYGEPLVTLDAQYMYPCAVGYGELPMHDIMSMLKKDGYDGYAVMEFYGASSFTDYIEESAEWIQGQINLKERKTYAARRAARKAVSK